MLKTYFRFTCLTLTLLGSACGDDSTNTSANGPGATFTFTGTVNALGLPAGAKAMVIWSLSSNNRRLSTLYYLEA